MINSQRTRPDPSVQNWSICINSTGSFIARKFGRSVRTGWNPSTEKLPTSTFPQSLQSMQSSQLVTGSKIRHLYERPKSSSSCLTEWEAHKTTYSGAIISPKFPFKKRRFIYSCPLTKAVHISALGQAFSPLKTNIMFTKESTYPAPQIQPFGPRRRVETWNMQVE